MLPFPADYAFPCGRGQRRQARKIPKISKSQTCADSESRGIAPCGCRAEPAIFTASAVNAVRRTPSQTSKPQVCALPRRRSNAALPRIIPAISKSQTCLPIPHKAKRSFAQYESRGIAYCGRGQRPQIKPLPSGNRTLAATLPRSIRKKDYLLSPLVPAKNGTDPRQTALSFCNFLAAAAASRTSSSAKSAPSSSSFSCFL